MSPPSPLNSVLTLIVKRDAALLDVAAERVRAVLHAAGIIGMAETVLSEAEARDIAFAAADRAGLAAGIGAALDGLPVDHGLLPCEGRKKRVLVADMDSTMIPVECIDELADYAGIKPEVSSITEAAMRGELDFVGALEARVALLAGMDVTVLERCHAERVTLMPGARTLIATMRRHGAKTMLVSGGFTFFTERVARAIGFDAQRANRLEIENGKLTGRVLHPVVTAATKRESLFSLMEEAGVGADRAMAVGDGANDIPMLEAAGLGVAYHAKPMAVAAADAAIAHADLTALLYLQGYSKAEFVAGE